MIDGLVARSERRDYGEMFRFDLNWGAPDHPPIELRLEDGSTITATNVSSYRGLRVFEVPTIPGSALEARMDHLIAKTTTNRLVIFHEPDRQAWRWPSRSNKGSGVVSRPARHLHRTGTNDPAFAAKLEAIRLPHDALLDVNAVLAKVRGAFDVESNNETKRASKLMARMYAALEKAYPASYEPKKRDHEISVTLARVLFLLFGDDTQMWASDLFQDFIKDHTARDGSDIAQRLNDLFRNLDTPIGSSRAGMPVDLATYPYVNGSIFKEEIALPALDHEFRAAVLDAAVVDWTTISPAILGSMFQSVRDAQTRRELGEHYTSEENILKTLNPLFLDELRSEFAHIQTLRRGRVQRLHALWRRLGDIRYMDPACGCGNFIIVAYRELREIELQIMEALADLQHGEGSQALEVDWTSLLRVTLDHFYGIEIDEWPARIAETAMFLVDRQCDLRMQERFGVAPDRLPIRRQAHIMVGSALKLDWREILPPTENVIIAGNPPFLGIALRSAAQTVELQAAWGGNYHGTLDYVTGWHACALRYFGEVDGRWAFVTTNSITQGEAVAPLFRPILNQGWQIKFAHRTFKWTSEASGQAVVHCVIVGYQRQPAVKRLFDYASVDSAPVEVLGVKNISPYLTAGPSVIVDPAARPLSPQMGEVAYGNKPTDGGWLVVEPEDRDEVLLDPIAAKYLRPYIGARELLHGGERYCLWLVDVDPADLRKSPVLRARVAAVRRFRSESKAESTRQAANTPHLFRQLAQPDTAYLCIPAHVSENRPYFLAARYSPDVITSNANFLSEDSDGLVFAVISSSMFMTWQRTVGGRIKSDLRFNKLLSWNTFPLPDLSPASKAAIADGGAAVLAAREKQGGTPLANMYPPTGLAPDLQAAHDALDLAVDTAFGVPSRRTLTELDRQDILFECYLGATAKATRAIRPPSRVPSTRPSGERAAARPATSRRP
ncbi:class I SAM-dependent DNA methyltransferase [Micromonospora aurantiaca (nom. illeg.)]|uniref:class I SAM-dependent DNA methyltransferase n=1 Tax=Micromonospora aurantiaca (nom. illeg.) TaxID=47850 RepID=UPI003DA6623F